MAMAPLYVYNQNTPPQEALRKIVKDIDAQPAQEYTYPSVEPSQQDEAKLLSEQMNELSMEDREQLYEELHGVERDIEEYPDFVASKLEGFQIELDKIKAKPAYEEALRMDSEYCNQRSLRLKFLRADRFNVKRAAYRWVSCFEVKKVLWGYERLTQEITLLDLDDDAMSILRSGVLQIVPTRDRAGRKVLCNFQKQQNGIYANPDNMVSETWMT